MTSYCSYTPTGKEQSTQNQTKMCAIMVFYVYFVLYIELLFGNVGLNGSLGAQIAAINNKWDSNSNISGTLNVKSPYSGTVSYAVRFGTCTVTIDSITAPNDQTDGTILEGLPAAAQSGTWLIHDCTKAYDSAKLGARVSVIPGKGILLCYKLSNCKKLQGSFSYPIIV